MSPVSQPEVVSLGCRLNIAESETIRALVGARAGSGDVAVVNSCAVTNEAVKQTRAAIRRLRRDRPGAELVVTGCAATIDPAGFAGMAEVDRIVLNADKLFPASWGAPDAIVLPAAFAGHARAFVEVQNGCDHRCTFCAIPFGRGPSRSLPAGAVIDRVRAAVAAGHREVVLTGVDVTSWGGDLPGTPGFGALVERVLTHVPDLERLRLSSLDSIEMDDRLVEVVTGDARVMPHLHLSLQAGSDLILKRMKRRHSRAQAIALVERLKARRPAIAIGADIIAGFPTEDNAAFADSLALVAECDIVHAHIFPYSPRAGTPAARMPQVAPDVRRDRAARLRDAAAAQRRRWLTGLVGTHQRVLAERPGTQGHAENFAPVRFAESRLDGAAEPGTVVRVDVTAATDTHLLGTIA